MRKGPVAALVVILAATPFVIGYEDVVTAPYVDMVGVKTVCGGETQRDVVDFKTRFTRDECVAILGAGLYRYAQELDTCIRRPLTTDQAVAVLSWAWNVGTPSACRSTLVRLINAGRPAVEWCRELLRWDRAGGKTVRGLTRRREAEYRTCLRGP